jgi:hypothetical protein
MNRYSGRPIRSATRMKTTKNSRHPITNTG